MTNEEREELYKKMIDTWGEEAQMRMCIEEMSELIKEICKYQRFKQLGETDKIEQTKQNIIEETGDTFNCIEQLCFMLGKDAVDQIRDFKLARTEKKLENYIKNNRS